MSLVTFSSSFRYDNFFFTCVQVVTVWAFFMAHARNAHTWCIMMYITRLKLVKLLFFITKSKKKKVNNRENWNFNVTNFEASFTLLITIEVVAYINSLKKKKFGLKHNFRWIFSSMILQAALVKNSLTPKVA